MCHLLPLLRQHGQDALESVEESTLTILVLDHVDDPSEALLQALIRQPRCLLDPDFAPEVAITGKSKLIAYFRVCQCTFDVLFVGKDEDWDLRISCL